IGELVDIGAARLLIGVILLIDGVVILIDIADAVQLYALIGHVGHGHRSVAPQGLLDIEIPVNHVGSNNVSIDTKNRARIVDSIDWIIGAGNSTRREVAKDRIAGFPITRNLTIGQRESGCIDVAGTWIDRIIGADK